jgi:hypothetical protein
MVPKFWFRKIRPITQMTDWYSANPHEIGDPDTLKGGIDLPGLEGKKLFLWMQGTGDGQGTTQVLPPFFGHPPIPSLGLALRYCDGAVPDGSATVVDINPTSLFQVYSFPNTPGAVRTTHGWDFGMWYWEFQLSGHDIFTSGVGTGVCVEDATLTYMFGTGEKNSTDVNGGALIRCAVNPPYLLEAGACGVSYPVDPISMEDSTFALCIAISPNQPVTVIRAQDFQPVPLPCVPCCSPCGCPTF